jgi:hypothetical protein
MSTDAPVRLAVCRHWGVTDGDPPQPTVTMFAGVGLRGAFWRLT